jgi:hypothetical protein
VICGWEAQRGGSDLYSHRRCISNCGIRRFGCHASAQGSHLRFAGNCLQLSMCRVANHVVGENCELSYVLTGERGQSNRHMIDLWKAGHGIPGYRALRSPKFTGRLRKFWLLSILQLLGGMWGSVCAGGQSILNRKRNQNRGGYGRLIHVQFAGQYS